MTDPLKAAARIEQIREELRQIKSEFPDLYRVVRGSILPDDQHKETVAPLPSNSASKKDLHWETAKFPFLEGEEPYTPVTQGDDESKPNWAIIADYLDDNPWQTLREIAEGTGIRFSIVNSTIYCSGKGRFTSRTDPRSKDKRAKVWNVAQVGETSKVGNKRITRPSTRKTTTKMIVQWLESNGPASVADISAGIQSEVKTDTAKLKDSVRSILSRLASDNLMDVTKVDGGNLYSIPRKHKEG